MNDKEKLDLIEEYVRTLLNDRIRLQVTKKSRFGMSLRRFNKVDCAYLEGEIDALSKVLKFIKNRLRDYPSADTVKVTRCKNCVHGIMPDCIPSEKAKIKYMCNIDQKTHIGNFFCADGTLSIPYSEEEISIERKDTE